MKHVSISQLKTFKACRRKWYFSYKEKLRPVKKSEALEMGSNYHKKIEQLYADGFVDTTEKTKETAMAVAYAKYIYPHIKCNATEEWKRKQLDDIILEGIVDGIADDGCIVEHKTTSRDVGVEYEYNLLWDEQVLMYMFLTDTRKIHYTVCRKPTIHQKKNESEEEFFDRMVAWYDEDTETKIRTFDVIRTDDEVNAFVEEALQTIKEMDGPCYRNTMHCMSFGSDCPYKSICLQYDSEQEYVEFIKEE